MAGRTPRVKLKPEIIPVVLAAGEAHAWRACQNSLACGPRAAPESGASARARRSAQASASFSTAIRSCRLRSARWRGRAPSRWSRSCRPPGRRRRVHCRRSSHARARDQAPRRAPATAAPAIWRRRPRERRLSTAARAAPDRREGMDGDDSRRDARRSHRVDKPRDRIAIGRPIERRGGARFPPRRSAHCPARSRRRRGA